MVPGFRTAAKLFGPIFAKDALALARQRRTFVFRAALGLAMAAVFWLTFERNLAQARANPGFAFTPWGQPVFTTPIRQMSAAAGDTAMALLRWEFIAVWFVVPALLCGAVTPERQRGTLDLLFTTQLTAREIILGKVGARLALALQWLLLPLPIVAIMGMLGGVALELAVNQLLLTLAAACCAAGPAIYFGARCRTPLRAVGMATMAIVLLHFLLPGMLFGAGNASATIELAYLPLLVAPGPQLMIEVSHPFGGRMLDVYLGLHHKWWTLAGCAATLLPWTAGAAARLRLALPPVRRPSQRGVSRDLTVWRRRPVALLGKWPLRNPLWVRARQAPVYDRDREAAWLHRYAGIAAVFAALFYLLDAFIGRSLYGGNDPQTAISVFLGLVAWVVIVASGALLAAAAPAADRRRGFLDAVLLTPLSDREIVDGTLAALWEHLRGLLIWGTLLVAVGLLHGATVAQAALTGLRLALELGAAMALALALGYRGMATRSGRTGAGLGAAALALAAVVALDLAAYPTRRGWSEPILASFGAFGVVAFLLGLWSVRRPELGRGALWAAAAGVVPLAFLAWTPETARGLLSKRGGAAGYLLDPQAAAGDPFSMALSLLVPAAALLGARAAAIRALGKFAREDIDAGPSLRPATRRFAWGGLRAKPLAP